MTQRVSSFKPGIFSDRMMTMLQSWVWWMLMIVIGVVWGLPQFPHYHRNLPYIYDLGGPIFVIWYLGFGVLSLGLYGLMTGLLHVGISWKTCNLAFVLAAGSVIVTGVLWWLQAVLINLSVRLG